MTEPTMEDRIKQLNAVPGVTVEHEGHQLKITVDASVLDSENPRGGLFPLSACCTPEDFLRAGRKAWRSTAKTLYRWALDRETYRSCFPDEFDQQDRLAEMEGGDQ